MGMKAGQAWVGFEVGEQGAGPPRVFRGDPVNRLQNAPGTLRDVTKIAQWGCDDVEGAWAHHFTAQGSREKKPAFWSMNRCSRVASRRAFAAMPGAMISSCWSNCCAQSASARVSCSEVATKGWASRSRGVPMIGSDL